MGVNAFLVGSDDPGGELVRIVARAGDVELGALGMASAANLSHDRGLHRVVGFLRGYAWHVARTGSAPSADVYRHAERRRDPWGTHARAVYGPAPDRVPRRFPHLITAHPAAPGCVVLPADFAWPQRVKVALPAPDPELEAEGEPWRVYLASAPRLLAELDQLDRWLHVPRASLAQLEALERSGPWDLESVPQLVPDSDPFCREQEAWLRLRCFLELAVRHRLALTAE